VSPGPRDDESGSVTASAGNSDDGAGDGASADDGTPPAGSRRDPLSGWISKILLRPSRPKTADGGTDPVEQLSDEEKGRRIRQIDSLERKLGYLAAVLMTVLAIGSTVEFIHNPLTKFNQTLKPVKSKCFPPMTLKVVKGVKSCVGDVYSGFPGHPTPRSHWVEELCVMLFFAVLIAVAVKIGRRSFVAFAAFIGGLAVENATGSVVGLAFAGLGAWLMVRAFRVQRYGTTNAKEVAAITASRRKGSSTSTPSSTGTRTTKKSKAASKPANGTRPTPTSNKRYTPKAPPKKKIPPPE
jgi:hypothetical protein